MDAGLCISSFGVLKSGHELALLERLLLQCKTSEVACSIIDSKLFSRYSCPAWLYNSYCSGCMGVRSRAG